MTKDLQNRFVKARRQYIANQFKDLNPMQKEAVLTTEGPLLLLAGAGSGKTTVLIHRIANLISYGSGSDSTLVPDTVTEADVTFLENLPQTLSEGDRRKADYLCELNPVAPWSVLAITFTNKAANQLKERLTDKVGPDAQDIWAMTFHAACCRILRRDIDRLGYTSRFTIYDTADSERLMKEILKDLDLDEKIFPARYVLGIISREKDKMVTPEGMAERLENTNDLRLEPVARAYKKYQTKLKENNALDFDDLICKTVELLQQFPEVRAYYQRKFRYVLVDEYQDRKSVV